MVFKKNAVHLFAGMVWLIAVWMLNLFASTAYSFPAIKIDGKLDDPLWKSANKYDNFAVHKTTEVPVMKTVAYVTHDDTAFYFGFVCEESSTAKLIRDSTRDFGKKANLDDCVEVMIDADSDSEGFYHFIISANGNHDVEYRTDKGKTPLLFDNLICYSSANVGTGQWSAELVVPFASITPEERLKNVVRLNLCRTRRAGMVKMKEDSSVAKNGWFLNPDTFDITRALTGVDTARYCCSISFKEVSIVHEGENVKISPIVEFANYSKNKTSVLFSAWAGKQSVVKDSKYLLVPGKIEETEISFYAEDKRNIMILYSLSDSKGEICTLYQKTPARLSHLLTIDIKQPFYKNNIYYDETVDVLIASATVDPTFWNEKEDKLVFRFMDDNGKVLASAEQYKNSGLTELDIKQIPVGTYTLTCEYLDNGVFRTVESKKVRKLAKSPALEARVDSNLNLIVNGKPEFPIIWWGGAGTVKDLADTGADGLLLGKNTRLMDELKENKMYGELMPLGLAGIYKYFYDNDELTAKTRNDLTSIINAVSTHPAVMCYYLIDEPEMKRINRNVLEEAYELISDIDPYHPVVICNDRIDRGIMTYYNALDIFFPDPYPRPKSDGTYTHPMMYMVDFLNAAKVAGNNRKLVGMTVQTFYGGVNHPLNRAPSFTEQRCMQWLPIVYGARGYNYYKYQDAINYPALKLGIPYIIKEIKAVEDVILLGTDTVPAGEIKVLTGIHGVVKKYKENYYLFTVNTTSNTVKDEFVIPEIMRTDNLNVLSENRGVRVQNNKYSDTYRPFEVHIYCTDSKTTTGVVLKDVEAEITNASGVVDFIGYK
ncbi:MAG: hypothetical protein WC955_04840 [Elusimicrobiota bacterium]